MILYPYHQKLDQKKLNIKYHLIFRDDDLYFIYRFLVTSLRTQISR
jgi:hypothetical protein